MPFYRRLAFRFAAVAVGLVVLTIGYFATWLYRLEHEALQERFGLALERIVATAALGIDGDLHRQIRTLADVDTPAFRAIQEHVRRVQAANYLREDLLYTLHLESPERARAGVMLQAVPYTGDLYVIRPENVPVVRRVLETKQAAHTKLYMDEHGEWVSAYAPILDEKGEVAGILEADYDISQFNAVLKAQLQRILALSLSAVALALILSVFFARRLEGALQRIREGAEAIEKERYDYRIQLRSHDELGLVARQFNRMAEVLYERFHLLKFLPRHTLEAIAQRVKEGRAAETERVEASILFSDIRGYTSISQGLSDEQVVAMLNQYLRRQAELVEERGGTIDKFIGDAVLAVFTGEGHPACAVEAALSIQEEVARMNARGAFEREVHIGIGVASGSLVLGEIGSDERRERTIIGSVVNLASRLCSHAGAGEVVICDATRAALGARLEVASSEEVPLKGFSGAQRCHLVRELKAPASALP